MPVNPLNQLNFSGYRPAKYRGPSYFVSRAFFKKKLNAENRVTIPKTERRIANIGVGDTVHVAVVSPYDEIDSIYISDVEVSSQNVIYLPTSKLESSKEVFSLPRFRQTVEPEDEDIRQFILREKDTDITPETSSRATPNKEFLFNNAIYKRRVKSRSDADTKVVTIPSYEADVVGIEDGDKVDVVIIDGNNIPFRKRSVFRANVFSSGTSLKFSIPSTRARIMGLEHDDTVQIVARKV